LYPSSSYSSSFHLAEELQCLSVLHIPRKILISLRSGDVCFFSSYQGRLDRPQAGKPPSCAAPPFLHKSLAPLADHPVERAPSLSYGVWVATGDALCHLDKPFVLLS
jgi:hypothetical protein